MKSSNNEMCDREFTLRMIRCIVVGIVVLAVCMCGMRIKKEMFKGKGFLVYKIGQEAHITKAKHKYNECLESFGKMSNGNGSASDAQATCKPLLKKKKSSKQKSDSNKKDKSQKKDKSDKKNKDAKK